jgi:malonyl-CoA/methylmalonyl-CoA synthetase
LPADAAQLLQICESSCLLSSPSLLERAANIQQYQQSQCQNLTVLPIQTGLPSASSLHPILNEDAVIGPSRPCLVLFTSGTTGPPKAVVIPRSLLDNPKRLKKNGVNIICRPPNHIGVCSKFLFTIFQGGTLDIVPDDGAILWERIRKWETTTMSAPPPIWQQMMDFFRDHIAHLPADERDQYICGLRTFSPVIYGAVASPLLLDFWRDLGQPLISVYGSTETGGGVFMSTNETDTYLKVIDQRYLRVVYEFFSPQYLS